METKSKKRRRFKKKKFKLKKKGFHLCEWNARNGRSEDAIGRDSCGDCFLLLLSLSFFLSFVLSFFRPVFFHLKKTVV